MSGLLNGFNNGRDATDGVGGHKLIDLIANEVDGSDSGLHLQRVSQRSELFFAFVKWAKQADLDYPDEMLLTDFEQFNAKNCG